MMIPTSVFRRDDGQRPTQGAQHTINPYWFRIRLGRMINPLKPFPFLPTCRLGLLLVFSAVLLLSNGCGKSHKDGKKQNPPIPVDAAQVLIKDSPIIIPGIGNVVALNSVDIKSRVTGELIEIFFKAGDPLVQGQKLFTIDPAPFEAKVKEIDAKLKQSRVQFEQAKREWLRFQGLYSEKAVSQEQLETKEVDMNSKRYQVELTAAELESAKLNLGYCFITSPLDGESGERYIDNFNIVNANQDRLVTIKQIRPIKVRFSLPGKFLDQIASYQSSGPLEVQAFMLRSDKPEIGSLTLIDNYINPKTGMIMLEGTFPNSESRLWPGQFVEVRLKLTVIPNAVLIPERAINEGPEGQYVWTVSREQSVAMRPIKSDRRDGNMAVVSEGLQSGDMVITDGQLMLYPGAQIITRDQLKKMAESKAPGKGSPDSGQTPGGSKTEQR